MTSESGARPDNPGNGDFLRGIVLGMALHVLQIPLGAGLMLVSCGGGADPFCSIAALVPVFAIGVSQLVYIVPAILIAYFRHRREIAKGVAVAAAATFALNATCFGGLALISAF